ncbi:MAG: tetratricopeptide repeat protein, partial [Pirellulaceae bacterium]
MVECKWGQGVAKRQFRKVRCRAIMAVACLLAIGCQPSTPKAPTATSPTTGSPNGTAESPAAPPPNTPPGVDRPSESAAKSQSLEQLQQQALNELEKGELEPAWKTVQQALLRSPSDLQTQFIAARILHARGKIQEAIALLDQVPIDSPQGGLAALGQAAEWEAASGRLRQAEARLRKLLELAPQATPAHRLMVRILNVQGRRWESRSHLYALIEAGDFTQDEVAMLIDFAEPFGEKAFSDVARKVAPDDPLVQLGAVRSMLYKNRYDEALPALQSIVAREKEMLEPWVWLGHVLVSQEKFDQLPSWLAAAPPGHLKHPQFWTIRGRWCELERQIPEAAKCYAQALQQDPRHLAATARLAECLTEMGEVELAEPVRKRSFQLAQMSSIAQDVIRGSGPPDGLQRLESGYQELNDPYMAFAWASLRAFR